MEEDDWPETSAPGAEDFGNDLPVIDLSDRVEEIAQQPKPFGDSHLGADYYGNYPVAAVSGVNNTRPPTLYEDVRQAIYNAAREYSAKGKEKEREGIVKRNKRRAKNTKATPDQVVNDSIQRTRGAVEDVASLLPNDTREEDVEMVEDSVQRSIQSTVRRILNIETLQKAVQANRYMTRFNEVGIGFAAPPDPVTVRRLRAAGRDLAVSRNLPSSKTGISQNLKVDETLLVPSTGIVRSFMEGTVRGDEAESTFEGRQLKLTGLDLNFSVIMNQTLGNILDLNRNVTVSLIVAQWSEAGTMTAAKLWDANPVTRNAIAGPSLQQRQTFRVLHESLVMLNVNRVMQDFKVFIDEADLDNVVLGAANTYAPLRGDVWWAIVASDGEEVALRGWTKINYTVDGMSDVR